MIQVDLVRKVGGLLAVSAGLLVAAAGQPDLHLSPPAPPEIKERPPLGARAPELSAKDWLQTDRPPRLADLRGKVILLEFWATWCIPCVKNIPHLNELQEEYGPKGLRILGVTVQSRKDIEAFVKQMDMRYTVGAGSALAAEYGVAALPYAFLIDKAGKIAWHGNPAEEDVEKQIQALLRKP